MAEIADLGGASLFLRAVLIVGGMVALFGLVLFANLLMDLLDARFGPRGFFGALVGVGMFGGTGGVAGWEIHQQIGAYVGAFASLAAGIAVVYLAFRRTEDWMRGKR